MPEGVAEAVVTVFQHAATMPDISHLATKADLEAQGVSTKADIDALRLATKADIDALRLATKTDIDALRLATKADVEALHLATEANFTATNVEIDAIRKEMATKADVADVRLEIANLRADFHVAIRQQGWLLLGGVGVLLTISSGMAKLLG